MNIQNGDNTISLSDEQVNEVVNQWMKENSDVKAVIFRKIEHLALQENTKFLPEIMEALIIGVEHPKMGRDLLEIIALCAVKFVAIVKAEDAVSEQLSNSSPKETLYNYFRQS